MPKYSVKLTCEDYYDYVGTNKFYHSFEDRIKSSLPSCINLKSCYNFKAKVVKGEWDSHRWYRVSFSIKMEEKDFHKMENRIKDHIENYCHGVSNFSWHQIKKNPKVSMAVKSLVAQ
jgi:hypothetical protein